MITVVLALCMGLMNEIQATPQAEAHFGTLLAVSSRGELSIIERLKNLREATNKLPDNWRSVMKWSGGNVMTKDYLLREIESMELSAAERWSILVENSARLDVDQTKLTKADLYARRRLDQLPVLHLKINQKLDEFNSRLKDGILNNMAAKLLAR